MARTKGATTFSFLTAPMVSGLWQTLRLDFDRSSFRWGFALGWFAACLFFSIVFFGLFLRFSVETALAGLFKNLF